MRRFRRHGAARAGLIVFLLFGFAALIGPFISPYDPAEATLSRRLEPPSLRHPLGMDQQGRDLLKRIVFGGRISLLMGLIAVGLSAVIGVPLGALAGFQGGRLDRWLMSFVDVLLAFPAILVAIVVVALLGSGIRNAMFAIGIAQMPVYARLMRAEVIRLRGEVFVEAARALGATEARIIARHLFPNSLGPLIVQGTLNLAGAILAASYLGFLGLGAQPPSPEWGAMLADGRTYLRVAPHVAVFPGLAVMLIVLAFNLMGDGLRDALDPRATRR